MSEIRWGMLSTANIGRVVTRAIRDCEHATFAGVASRDAEKAGRFAEEEGIPRSFGSYEQLLASDVIDAVYVPLPISMHTEWTGRALEAGKHVLCEKPFAMTAEDAARCFTVAERTGQWCIEGLMYRHHPQTLLARKLVADGAIGRLAHVRAALTVSAPEGDIRRTGRLGGGASLDLGCYCISAVRLFAGQPRRVYAERVVDPAPGAERGDLRLAATLSMPDDRLAQFDVALDYPRRDELELIGTNGKITIPDPWLCRSGYVELERDGVAERLPADPEGEFSLGPAEEDAYRIEFEVASATFAGAGQPAFGRADAVDQAAVLEAVRRSAEGGRPIELSAPEGAASIAERITP